MTDQLRTIDTPVAIGRLGRLFQIEKALMLVAGARLAETVSWNLKQRLGYHLYDDMRHADALRRRRQELPGGRREPGELDADMWKVLNGCLHAAGDAPFCSAMYLAFKPMLIDAYRAHLDQATTAADVPGRQIIERIIADEQQQQSWIEGALAMMDATPDERKRSAEIVEQVRAWVAAAGGMLGESDRRPAELPDLPRYQLAKDARREPRQRVTLDFIVPDGPAGVHREVMRMFTGFFREMAAAETVGGLLWDAPPQMPWEFFADTARHCWDEVRHCQVGQQRLEKFGYDIWQVPVQTGNYNVRARMTPLERYAFITQHEEKCAFGWKHDVERISREAGDSLSADMLAYDISDETAHVKYGVKWIPQIQQLIGDQRTFEQLVADAGAHRRAVYEQLVGEHGPGAMPSAGY